MPSLYNKRILLEVSSLPKVSFILRTKFFEYITKELHWQVVLLTPFSEEDWFIKEFGREGVYFSKLRDESNAPILGFIKSIRDEALKVKHPEMVRSRVILDHFHKRHLAGRSRLGLFVKSLILFLIPQFLKRDVFFWDRVESLFSDKGFYLELIDKFKPEVAIVDSWALAGLLNACQFMSIPAVLIDLNIDAFGARMTSSLRPAIKKVTLLGPSMFDEAVEINGIDRTLLEVIGSVRYDHYFLNKCEGLTKDLVIEPLNIDATKKIITYATVDAKSFPYNFDIIEIILDAINNGELNDCHLLVDHGKINDQNDYEERFKGYDNVSFIKSETIHHKETVRNLICSSDVVVSVGSTIGLESCAVGVPAIWIGFDGYKKIDNYLDSIRAAYDLNYLRQIYEGGGVSLANSPSELIRDIRRAVDERGEQVKSGFNMVSRVFFKPDGFAHKRLADLISKIQ